MFSLTSDDTAAANGILFFFLLLFFSVVWAFFLFLAVDANQGCVLAPPQALNLYLVHHLLLFLVSNAALSSFFLLFSFFPSSFAQLS
jgi:hypothetical protein